jgi:hypothetical protein
MLTGWRVFEIHFGDEFFLSQELTSIPTKKHEIYSPSEMLVGSRKVFYFMHVCVCVCVNIYIYVYMVNLAHNTKIDRFLWILWTFRFHKMRRFSWLRRLAAQEGLCSRSYILACLHWFRWKMFGQLWIVIWWIIRIQQLLNWERVL